MPGRHHEKQAYYARLLMSIGALVYLVGIWRTCPLFSGKGYFLGVLVMGMFAVSTHQRTAQAARRRFYLAVPAGGAAVGGIAAGRPGLSRLRGVKKVFT
jgi:hypothetical protein